LEASFWKIVLGQPTAAASIVARKVEAYLRTQVCSVNDGGRRSGGGRWHCDWRASHLLAVDHEIGEEAVVEVNTKLARRPAWEVVASRFELPR
jgi:hypothetical protein